MKKKIIIPVVLAAILLTAVLFKPHKMLNSPAAPVMMKETSNAVKKVKSHASGLVNNVSGQISRKDKTEQMREGLQRLNDVNIVVHGKVIDQFGKPIVGAVISAGVGVNNGVSTAMIITSNTETDVQGLFYLSGYKGKDIGIDIKKTGYAYIYTNAHLIFSHLWPEAKQFHPNGTNPVIFTMWKLQGAQSLISFDVKLKPRNISGLVYIDFAKGTTVESGGDLKITLVQPASGEMNMHHPKNWSVAIEAVNGGLIESDDISTTYWLPENGYKASYFYNYDAASQYWQPMTRHDYFVRSQNGHHYSFAMITVDMMHDMLTVIGQCNTNSSRNFEGARR